MEQELFIVEGKSAESTLNQALDRDTQRVFALQGKLLNVQSLAPEKIHQNAICARLFNTLGCGTGEHCRPDQLRFQRIVFLTDPDVDGAHTRALLAVLFMRLLAPLVAAQRVFAVIPPGWRVRYEGVKEPAYLWTDEELQRLKAKIDAAREPTVSLERLDVTRFKGVAQFSPQECVQWLLNPSTRRQVLLSLTA